MIQTPLTNPLAADLEEVVDLTRPLWDDLRGERLFITGGTGFFGCWLLESFLWANDRLNLGASAVVLSRDPLAFEHKCPRIAAHPAIDLQRGDVVNFDAAAGSFPFVIHAATDASARMIREAPMAMINTIVDGARRVLEFAATHHTRRFLFTSSGAVYGPQPAGMHLVPETYQGGPDCTDPLSSYAEAKRLAELLCTVYGARHGLHTCLARCFAFAGPYLPLDAHFAIGNFVRDAMYGPAIQVAGDGMTVRSYLYASDLAAWLWTILFRGAPARPYNVGSEAGLSIAELAQTVAATLAPATPVHIARSREPGRVPDRYVPSTARARTELGLRQTVSLPESLVRMARWHTVQPAPARSIAI